MRFWLPYRAEPPDRPPVVTDDPEVLEKLRARGVHIIKPQLRVERLGLVIHGEYETKNAGEVQILMKVGGALRFVADDAVVEGILSPRQVQEMGFALIGEYPEEQAGQESIPLPEIEPVKPPLPDFYTMSKNTLIEWALDQTPPINLDPRKRKDDIVAALEAELRKRGD